MAMLRVPKLENAHVRRALFIAALLLIALAMGTIGFVVIEGYSVFDAFYMTLITITTVGYEEIHPLSHAGRIFNSVLILFGVAAMFIAVGAMTQTIIEFELRDRFGARRKRKMLEGLTDHVIVCGFGRVGRNAAFELQRVNAPVVVIDNNEQRVQRAMEAGLLAVEADATHDDTLRAVGVTRAKGLIASLAGDAENLFIILSAKTLNPNLKVVTRASEEEAEVKLRRGGADIVLTPYTIVGHHLAQALVKPQLVQFMNFTAPDVGPKVEMEQMMVSGKSALVKQTFLEVQQHFPTGVILLAVLRANGQMMFKPDPSTLISAGDYLIAIGQRAELAKMERVLAPV